MTEYYCPYPGCRATRDVDEENGGLAVCDLHAPTQVTMKRSIIVPGSYAIDKPVKNKNSGSYTE